MIGHGFEIFFLIQLYGISPLNIFIKKIKHVMNLFEKIVWSNFYVKGIFSNYLIPLHLFNLLVLNYRNYPVQIL
jgi:hypothetical protein